MVLKVEYSSIKERKKGSEKCGICNVSSCGCGGDFPLNWIPIELGRVRLRKHMHPTFFGILGSFPVRWKDPYHNSYMYLFRVNFECCQRS